MTEFLSIKANERREESKEGEEFKPHSDQTKDYNRDQDDSIPLIATVNKNEILDIVNEGERSKSNLIQIETNIIMIALSPIS